MERREGRIRKPKEVILEKSRDIERGRRDRWGVERLQEDSFVAMEPAGSNYSTEGKVKVAREKKLQELRTDLR